MNNAVMTEDDHKLLSESEHFNSPKEFLEKAGELIKSGVREFRLGLLESDDDPDTGAVWFRCDTGSILIDGPHDLMQMLHDFLVTALRQLTDEGCTCGQCGVVEESSAGHTVH